MTAKHAELSAEEWERLLEDWTGFDGLPDAPLSQSVLDMRRLLAAYAAVVDERDRLRNEKREQERMVPHDWID